MNKKEYLEKRQELYAEAEQLIETGKIEEAEKNMQAIKELDEQFENASRAAANLRAMSQTPVPLKGIGEGEMMGTQTEDTDMYDTVEYRKAFMNLMVNGTPLPEKFRNEAGPTKTTDTSAVIAPTVVRRIVEKMQVMGNIMNLVTHTAFPAGVTVPTCSILEVIFQKT